MFSGTDETDVGVPEVIRAIRWAALRPGESGVWSWPRLDV